MHDVRAAVGPAPRAIVGHLGTYGSPIASLLSDVLIEVLRKLSAPHILLMGVGSQEFLASFSRSNPQHARRITATGPLPGSALAAHVAACDVLVQPYPDGISSRRTSAMAGLHLGVPIVTTTGALTEPFWDPSNAVRMSRVGDWVTFVDHVDRLLQDPDERARLARGAREFYDAMFDMGRTVAALRAAA